MCLVLHVSEGGSIGGAIDSARTVYKATGRHVTVLIEPGTYYEELTIDVPFLTLKNAASKPGIGLLNGGVATDEGAVRISWYCGHGYQYRSMGGSFNYGGKRTRRWNATVLVTAQGFTAENIIFENSFNQYVSPAELRDSLWDISQADTDWTRNERPKRLMLERPRREFSTEVQKKPYIERAAALSFVKGATDARLVNCRCVGHQDVLYGDHGAEVTVEGGVVQGTVDFIFGGMDLTVRNAQLVIGGDDGQQQCYIAAGRGFAGSTNEQNTNYKGLELQAPDSISTAYGNVPADEVAEQGMVFENCSVRYATPDEVVNPAQPVVCFARPWRWWGRHLFVGTVCAPGLRLSGTPFNLGLTKGREAPWCEVR